MKYPTKMFITLVMLMALAMSTISAIPAQEEMHNEDEDDSSPDYTNDTPLENDQSLPTSLRGTSRFLAQKPRGSTMTCNKYPRVCRTPGSPGPDCCKKKCVNVMTDKLNCGLCGRKCKHPEICCKGDCVNLLSNKRHCGGCNNRCKKGNSCVYGMCNYA